MLRFAASAAVLAAVALVVAVSAFSGGSATITLNGTVGPGYKITLTRGGKLVKTLPAGTVKLVVADKAGIHAFSLDGPHGYAKDFTTIPFTGTKTFFVKLRAGKYKYYCPNHESIMFGHFTVS